MGALATRTPGAGLSRRRRAERAERAGALTPLVGGATVVFAGAAVGQVAGFVFNAVGAHALGPTRYGTLAASLALLSLSTPLFTAAQTVASRETTALVTRGESSAVPALLRRYGGRAALGAALLGAAVAASGGWVAGVFHLGSPWFVVIVGATIPCYMVGHVLGGVLQGLERFSRFALESVVEGAAKAVLGVLAVAVVFHSAVLGLAAVMASCALGCLTYVALTVPVVARLGRGAPARATRAPALARPGIAGYSVTALATYGLLSLMLSVDTLVAKHYLPGRLAGLYAGISVTGKIDFFATSALFVVVFPLFSRHHDRGSEGRAPVLAAGAVVLAVSGAIVAALALRPAWVVEPLLGSRYRAADGYVAAMAAIFSLYALSYLLSTYLLARRRRSVIALLAATFAAQLAGFFVFHSTIAELMSVLAVTFGFLFGGAALLAGVGRPPAAPAGAPRPDVAPSAGVGLPQDWRERVVGAVRAAVGPAPVLLAGSRACATATPASDCDLSVALPLWRVPGSLGPLGRAADALSADLGVPVSVNPVPRHLLARPAGRLYVDKLLAEAVVLDAPPGWTLHRRAPTKVTPFAAASALLSATAELLRGFDPTAMRGRAGPGAPRALAKAALLVAQVRLLRLGAYESDLDGALEALRARDAAGGLADRLATALMEPHAVDGFVELRDCVLDELGPGSRRVLPVSRAAALARGAQHRAIAWLRGRGAGRRPGRRRPGEADLAEAQLALLRALRPGGPGVDDARLAEARRALRIDADASWEQARHVALREWADAHPLVGLFA